MGTAGILIAFVVTTLVPAPVPGQAASEEKGQDVPMTRASEALAVLEGIGGNGTFAELSDGKILFSNGGGRFRTSTDGGLSWPVSWQSQDPDGRPLGAGESGLVSLAGGAIGYAVRYETREGGQSDEFIAFFRSEDGGRNWSRPVRVTPAAGDDGVAQLNDAVVRTTSGRIIVPVYSCIGLATDPNAVRRRLGAYLRDQWIPVGAHDYDPKFCWSSVYYSDDEGHTWRGNRSGKIFIWDEAAMTWNRATEPTVAEVSPGRLLMFVRTELGRMFQSWSSDNGETWTAPTATLLAASSAPAQLRRIPATGDLLAVWSQASEEEIRKGLIRSRLSTAVSRSQGAVWEFFQNIDSALEQTRIEPGPLRRVRPEGIFLDRAQAQPVRPESSVIELPENYRLTSYPSVFFFRDRVLVGHTNAHFKEDGTYVMPGRLRVVPVSWLYGGPERMKRNGFYQLLKKRFP